MTPAMLDGLKKKLSEPVTHAQNLMKTSRECCPII